MKPEAKRECLVCGHPEVDRAHIKTKGSGGTMDDFNIMLLCRIHHVEQHKIGILTFIEKHDRVKRALARKGWVIETEFDRRVLRRKEK